MPQNPSVSQGKSLREGGKPEVRVYQNSFTRGILRPEAYARPDLEAYNSGLAEADNMILNEAGGLQNRPMLKAAANVATPRFPALPERMPFVRKTNTTIRVHPFGHQRGFGPISLQFGGAVFKFSGDSGTVTITVDERHRNSPVFGSVAVGNNVDCLAYFSVAGGEFRIFHKVWEYEVKATVLRRPAIYQNGIIYKLAGPGTHSTEGRASADADPDNENHVGRVASGYVLETGWVRANELPEGERPSRENFEDALSRRWYWSTFTDDSGIERNWLFASAVGVYDDFDIGDGFDTDAIAIELPQRGGKILHVVVGEGLHVFQETLYSFIPKYKVTPSDVSQLSRVSELRVHPTVSPVFIDGQVLILLENGHTLMLSVFLDSSDKPSLIPCNHLARQRQITKMVAERARSDTFVTVYLLHEQEGGDRRVSRLTISNEAQVRCFTEYTIKDCEFTFRGGELGQGVEIVDIKDVDGRVQFRCRINRPEGDVLFWMSEDGNRGELLAETCVRCRVKTLAILADGFANWFKRTSLARCVLSGRNLGSVKVSGEGDNRISLNPAGAQIENVDLISFNLTQRTVGQGVEFSADVRDSLQFGSLVTKLDV